MSNPFMDYLTSSALSLTMAGNTGISPFLTLFILGVVEKYDPELLNMGEMMEVVLSSWVSLVVLGVLALGEEIAKCIPAIDELIDSAEVFIVPVISVVASLATMGLMPDADQSRPDGGVHIDVVDLIGDEDNGLRSLQVETDDSNDFGEGIATFGKVCLVIFGMFLALSIHLFKMAVRTSSLLGSGGCCQPCITITENVAVIFGVIIAIVSPIFAVLACIAFFAALAYMIRLKCCKKDDGKEEGGAKDGTASSNKTDVEDQKATIQAVVFDTSEIPTANKRSSSMEDVELTDANPY
mmetsp:Transcript_10375/g.30332  ORF Transcript_10375/g.30332 Transcript_10375/m.30332 type:complete len:296 (-) Transcript_10375:141-1028(-)|eukprot:CAMPEP_0172355748 /NCGR_PEP_ID=MMETSP1060-20121228/148_1 /TAXON_ID=37318 /ORGANISM="Pseudo-nitzschia pungens, Strain cf. cingulata" /LENGTH=295 /DNA_ID=CAMNT_0013075587 /DNA_START=209 /DNA_END=1096 /DNA_ORIENTATION=-